MEFEYDLGLNVLQRMLSKGLLSLLCDELECMSYNVNLDLVLRFFDKYPNLKKVSIWSNTEKTTYSQRNLNKLTNLIEEKRIIFYHVPENINSIHAKIYVFKKDSHIKFLAIGSPNLSDHSNQNFESIIYIQDETDSKSIWNEIPKIFRDLNIFPNNSPPIQLHSSGFDENEMNLKFLEGLWEHQKAALNWLATKRFSIVNIPPGTGKTEIAFRYLQYLFEEDQELTSIVLVPTLTLIDQWKERLERVSISNSEMGTTLGELSAYFADPGHHVLVTLYSRFFDKYRDYQKKAKILKPNVLLILDECHNTYGHLNDLLNFRELIESFGGKVYCIGLSATIDSFREQEVTDFIDLMGGKENRFEISLQSFYTHWNNLNSTSVLKPIRYRPTKYFLSDKEMDEYREYSKKIAIEMSKKTIAGKNDGSAAVNRARWLRGLQGGIASLENYIIAHMDSFSDRSTIIFVQTNEIAERLQRFIIRQPGWSPEASIYIYDSTKDKDYLSYALNQFRKNLGFCLISEKMLSEGFDLPKVDQIILYGSDRSPRDWIQKVGRAMRFDKRDPNSIADIIDIVFCDNNGKTLSMEIERYECLTAIGQTG